MKLVLDIKNALSQVLQRIDQDIVNVISLLATTKRPLYPDDFDNLTIEALACELDTFIANVHDVRLNNMTIIVELSRTLV